MKQLDNLQKEIQDSLEELDKISPLYENHLMEEKKITKQYVDYFLKLSIQYVD